MASTDGRPVPQKNVAYRLTLPILDADGDLVTGATSPDSEISKDGGTFADCTNEATEIATASGMYFLDLTSTEMNADTVAIIVKSGNGKTTPIVLYPEEGGDIRVNLTQWLSTAAATPTVAGVPEVDITHLVGVAQSATDLKDFADDGYDPSTNKVQGVVLTDTVTTYTGNTIQTGDSFARIGATGSGLTTLASQASVNTVDDFLDTEIADLQARVPAALVSGRMDSSVGAVAANAITDASVAADMDNYSAKIWVIKENTTTDHYAVRWFKNLVPITSGITSPTIQVIKGSDGTDLIASTALTEIGSTHRFKRDESTNKMTAGAIYFAVVAATIDGSSRSYEQQVGRDST